MFWMFRDWRGNGRLRRAGLARRKRPRARWVEGVMGKGICRFRVWGLVALAVLAAATWPRAVAADEAATDASELKLAREVSRALLGAQKAERELAKQAGFPEVEAELKSLRRAIGSLVAAEASPRLAQLRRGGAAAAAGTSAALEVRREEGVRKALVSLGGTKAKLEKSLEKLKSQRQRRLARRAAKKLGAIEAEVEAALASPLLERRSRLLALRQRLVVQRYGLGDSTPLPEKATPAWRVAERPPPRQQRRSP